jgi:hypothetical protein
LADDKLLPRCGQLLLVREVMCVDKQCSDGAPGVLKIVVIEKRFRRGTGTHRGTEHQKLPVSNNRKAALDRRFAIDTVVGIAVETNWRDKGSMLPSATEHCAANIPPASPHVRGFMRAHRDQQAALGCAR